MKGRGGGREGGRGRTGLELMDEWREGGREGDGGGGREREGAGGGKFARACGQEIERETKRTHALARARTHTPVISGHAPVWAYPLLARTGRWDPSL